jgi:signal transduction histidine kinase
MGLYALSVYPHRPRTRDWPFLWEVAQMREEDFFWAVVHELRQPLTSIAGQAQLAKRLLTTDPLRADEALDLVVAQVGRIDRVLTELRARAQPTTHHDGCCGSVHVIGHPEDIREDHITPP